MPGQRLQRDARASAARSPRAPPDTTQVPHDGARPPHGRHDRCALRHGGVPAGDTTSKPKIRGSSRPGTPRRSSTFRRATPPCELRPSSTWSAAPINVDFDSGAVQRVRCRTSRSRRGLYLEPEKPDAARRAPSRRGRRPAPTPPAGAAPPQPRAGSASRRAAAHDAADHHAGVPPPCRRGAHDAHPSRRRSSRQLVDRLARGDRSAALALHALICAADRTRHRRSFNDVAVQYRNDHLAALRAAGGDAEREAGRLSMDEVRGNLAASVLPRLASERRRRAAAGRTPVARRADPRRRAGLARRSAACAPSWRTCSSTRASTPRCVASAAAPRRLRPDGAAEHPRGARAGEDVPPAPVVNDVALRLQQGEIVGLLGPNGAGKTTTFYMIVGLIQPLAGSILLDGADITNMPMYQRARHGIGYLSQEPSIFRKLSVEDNILAILETLPLSASERRRAARDAAGRAEHQAPAAQQGVSALRRRAAAARDHAGARDAAEVHDAGRAVRGGRPDRRARHPDHRRRPPPSRHRRADQRPQRGADARHRRPRLHHVRRTGEGVGHRARARVRRDRRRHLSRPDADGAPARALRRREHGETAHEAGLSQNTQLKQELKINPRLYQAMDLLYMPLLDLQQHLKQELLNNPVPRHGRAGGGRGGRGRGPGGERQPRSGAGEGREGRDRLGGDPPRRLRRRRPPRGARGAGVLRAGHRRHARPRRPPARPGQRCSTSRRARCSSPTSSSATSTRTATSPARSRDPRRRQRESSRRPPRSRSATSTTCRCTRWPKPRTCSASSRASIRRASARATCASASCSSSARRGSSSRCRSASCATASTS